MMAALEPVIALLAIAVPLALAGVLVEWVARRQFLPHKKAERTAGPQRKTQS